MATVQATSLILEKTQARYHGTFELQTIEATDPTTSILSNCLYTGSADVNLDICMYQIPYKLKCTHLLISSLMLSWHIISYHPLPLHNTSSLQAMPRHAANPIEHMMVWVTGF